MLVAGCGGTGQSTNPTSCVDQTSDLAYALLTEKISNLARLPVTRRAIYVRFGTLDLAIRGMTQSYIGDLDLTVKFSSVSG